MPLPRPGRGAGKVSLAPPPHIHSSDPRKAGGWRQGEPLPASEPRTGGRGARGDPPSPQPAPTRLSRRRPSPPGAAPAAAAAPPTASCSAPDGRSRRAGPTCPERPQLGARPAPLPAGHCPFNRLPLPGALRLGSKFLPVIRSRGEEEEFVNVQFVQRDRCLLASPRPVLCVCESVCVCVCACAWCVCVCICGGCECVCERERECVCECVCVSVRV